MAAKDDKTEKPTGKRKQEARRKGQVAKSTDLNGALVLLAGMLAISSFGTSPGALGSLISSNATAVAQRAGLAYLAIAIIDYAWQRRRHNKSLKMTKQEVKEEGKQLDLPPEVKSAIRRRQFEAARRRM